MNDEIVVIEDDTTNNTAMVSYDAILAKLAEETQTALTQPKGNFISLKGKIFTLPDGTQLKDVDCIVVDYLRINQLLTPYVPSQRMQTLCWAIGRNDKTLAPNEDVENAESKTCATCPKNEFGSKGKGKACTNKIRLAIVPPDAKSNADIWLVQIPPTSLADWTNYVKMIERLYGTSGTMRIVTKIKMNPDSDYPKLVFQCLRPLPIDEADPQTTSLATIIKLRPAAEEAVFIVPQDD